MSNCKIGEFFILYSVANIIIIWKLSNLGIRKFENVKISFRPKPVAICEHGQKCFKE